MPCFAAAALNVWVVSVLFVNCDLLFGFACFKEQLTVVKISSGPAVI